jgi:hypothetical protein
VISAFAAAFNRTFRLRLRFDRGHATSSFC